MQAVKDTSIALATRLPKNCTWDDVMEQIYVRQKIEVGLEDADEGRHIPHEQAFEEFDDDTDPPD